MKPFTLLFFLASVAFWSCQDVSQGPADHPQAEETVFYPVGNAEFSRSCPYWAKDHQNRPVLCWSETPVGEELNRLCFATLDPISGMLGEAIEIPGTEGMQAHKESMAKIGFKADGTIVAVFRRSDPSPSNRFAGRIFTTFSTDEGKSWADPYFLVLDSTSQSQSFFDLEPLPNGELGLAWLDSRKLIPGSDGSTLYFATTDAHHTFSNAYPVDGTTCQCCRTDLYLDENDGLHLAFRDILEDSIRDMVHLVSQDGGASFSPPKIISNDNWVINGCPHTGPSLASSANGLACSWYTQSGNRGVYFSQQPLKKPFQKRILIDSTGAHPQMVSDGQLYTIALESLVEQDNKTVSQVVLFQTLDGNSFERSVASQRGQDAYNPVLFDLENGSVALAWTQPRDSVQEVIFRIYEF